MRVQWCQETLFQYWHSCGGRHWKSEKKEWSRFHHSFCSKSTLEFNFFPISPNLFVDPFWLWTFCSFCSKSVTYFLSISSYLFARLFWLDVVFLFSKIWQMSSGQSLICLSTQPKLQTTTENGKQHNLKT